jgi:hypothetical protein
MALAGWQMWNPAILNSAGSPYWNHASLDGPKKNVGFCMAGGGNCNITPVPGTLSFWGFADGTADTNIFFTNTGSALNTATLKIEIAGNANFNSFGWAAIDFGAGGVSIGPLVQIFAGADSAAAGATFTPTTHYVFYMEGRNGDVYYTYGSLNTHDANTQHFAVFNNGLGGYYLGIEDLRLNSSDHDYNDMVIQVGDLSVPEPGTLVLLTSGMLGLGGFRKKWTPNNKPIL